MTNRTRLVAYVPEDLGELVEETAAALGQTRSAFLSEILENSAPMFEVVRDLARELESAPGRQREALTATAEALRTMLGHASTDLATIETATKRDPRPVTRGSATLEISNTETPKRSKISKNETPTRSKNRHITTGKKR